MRLFFRFAAGLAISALLALLLLAAVMLVSPQAVPDWACGLPLAGKAVALAVSLILLFLVVFLSPCLGGSASVFSKKEERLTQAPRQSSVEENGQERAGVARGSPASESRAGAALPADLVVRAVEQAVVSLVPEAARTASIAAELSGRYVCQISGGFERPVPKESMRIKRIAPDPVTSRDGIFVIDSAAASSLEDGEEVDSDFKSLVDSVLA